MTAIGVLVCRPIDMLAVRICLDDETHFIADTALKSQFSSIL